MDDIQDIFLAKADIPYIFLVNIRCRGLACVADKI